MSVEIELLHQDMMAWLEGRLSHTNSMLGLSLPERRVETLACIAVADAQEVVQRAAAIQALAAEAMMIHVREALLRVVEGLGR